MADIYLVRHCETEGNAARRAHAQSESLVTRKGIAQSRALAERFRDIKIDRLYSSDSYRSVMTLMPMAQEKNLPINLRLRLREITVGIWESLAWGDIARDYPVSHDEWSRHPWDHHVPGAGTFEQIAEQLYYELLLIADEVRDGSAVCMSHSCTIKAGLCKILGRPLSDANKIGHSDNTCVSLIHVAPDHSMEVSYIYDDRHLTPDLKRAWSGVAGSDINMSMTDVSTPEDRKDAETLLSWMENDEAEKKQLQNLDLRKEEHVAVSYLHGKPSGMVVIRDRTGEVPLVYVVPELQGKGYGEQLLGHAIHAFRFSGREELFLTAPDTPEIRRLSERFLFEERSGEGNRRKLELFGKIPFPVRLLP